MHKQFAGFSLIELMIAVTIGMLSVAAVGSVFIYGSRNYKQDDKISRMQDELRFAMAQITLDLEMAGFWAQIRNPEQDIVVDASATVSTDCGPTTDGGVANSTNNWAYQERRAGIATLGDVDIATAIATFPCLDKDEITEGSDIIAVKRLGRPASPVATNDDGKVFMRTNGIDTTVYMQSAAVVQPTVGSITVFDYQPAVWYIRPYTVDNQNPPVPSLCRKRLTRNGAAPQMERDCVAQGIMDMQVEFGFDNDGDGAPDFFVEYDAAPDPGTVLARVVAVRVHLLARSSEADVGYANEKTYQLATQTRGPYKDGFYRRTLSTTVMLRNQANRLTPYSLPSG